MRLLLPAALFGLSPFCAAVAQAPGTTPSAAAPTVQTLAVLNFDNNTGRADYDPMGRGIAAMMITDLSASPDLKVVEREKMQDVLNEQNLQHSALFDSSTAVRAGRLLGAQYIATGSLAASSPQIRIDMRVIRVETGEIIKTAKVTGPEDKFFDLEQQLADHVLKDLDVAMSPESAAEMRKRQEANRQMGFDSFMALSGALASMDAGDYLTAADRMRPLMMKSPDSQLVELTYQEAKHRAAIAGKQKARDKAGKVLRGLFGKP
jgi:TolB-like protein